jgi:hypothetical protein
MTASDPWFSALFALTALNWSIHWYTHMVTYRLFPVVAEVAGGEGFVRYHLAYVSRLIWSIYIPWTALMLASIGYAIVHFGPVSLALLALNGSIAAVSVRFAAPIHARIDRAGTLLEADQAGLMRWNAVRLGVATVSLLTSTALQF